MQKAGVVVGPDTRMHFWTSVKDKKEADFIKFVSKFASMLSSSCSSTGDKHKQERLLTPEFSLTQGACESSSEQYPGSSAVTVVEGEPMSGTKSVW